MYLLNEMAVFAKVVQTRGFSAAARELGLTTSAVSRHVQRLEQHLGGRLLVRTTRQLAPTELGQQVAQLCQRIVEEARDIEGLGNQYRQTPQGKLTISAPVSLGQRWVAPLLAGFSRAYPEVTVVLNLLDRFVDMIEEDYDLVLRISRDLPPGLAVRPLQPVRYILIAAPDYLAQAGVPQHPSGLAAHQFILFGYGEFGGDWLLRSASGEKVKVQVEPRMTVNNSLAMLTIAEQGSGITLLPDYIAADSLASGKVQQLLNDWEFEHSYAPRNIVAAWHPTRHLPLKARVFIDYLSAHPYHQTHQTDQNNQTEV